MVYAMKVYTTHWNIQWAFPTELALLDYKTISFPNVIATVCNGILGKQSGRILIKSHLWT